MKRSLLASTAMGTLMAASSAHADDWGYRVFGGINLVDDDGIAFTTSTSFVTSSSVFFGAGTLLFSSGAVLQYDAEVEFDPDLGFVVGASVGYGFNVANMGNLNLELEGAYRRNKLDVEGGGAVLGSAFYFVGYHYNVSTGTFAPSDTKILLSTSTAATASLSGSGDGKVKAYSLMANAWYEFETGSKWKPFLGGGVGIAWVDLDGDLTLNIPTYTGTVATNIAFDADESGFAWQLGAGIGYEFKPNRQITLDYRYFRGPEIDEMTVNIGGSVTVIDPDYEYEAHSVMLGFKYGF